MSDQLLSLDAAEKLLGKSRRTIWRLLVRGVLEGRSRSGSRKRYVTRSSVEAYLAAQTEAHLITQAKANELAARLLLLEQRMERLERRRSRPRSSPPKARKRVSRQRVQEWLDKEGVDADLERLFHPGPDIDPYNHP